jgi:hypothetical protein
MPAIAWTLMSTLVIGLNEQIRLTALGMLPRSMRDTQYMKPVSVSTMQKRPFSRTQDHDQASIDAMNDLPLFLIGELFILVRVNCYRLAIFEMRWIRAGTRMMLIYIFVCTSSGILLGGHVCSHFASIQQRCATTWRASPLYIGDLGEELFAGRVS